MLFYFLIISFSQIFSITYYEYIYYLGIDKSLEYDSSFTTITVLDFSKVKGDTIFIEYKIDNKQFPTEIIKYNFTYVNETLKLFTCENEMKFKRIKYTKQMVNNKLVNYSYYYYFYFPKGNAIFSRFGKSCIFW